MSCNMISSRKRVHAEPHVLVSTGNFSGGFPVLAVDNPTRMRWKLCHFLRVVSNFASDGSSVSASAGDQARRTVEMRPTRRGRRYCKVKYFSYCTSLRITLLYERAKHTLICDHRVKLLETRFISQEVLVFNGELGKVVTHDLDGAFDRWMNR